MGKVYHGSSVRGLTMLEPRESTHGNYVYATPDRNLAIIFSKRCGDDCTYALYRNDKKQPWQLVERIPGAFKTMFSNSASIYTLDDATFKDIHTGFVEVVSEVSVKTESEEFVENVYDSIKKLASEGKVELYFYPDKPKEIPEDSSDLIDLQLRLNQINKVPATKRPLGRLVLLHPDLMHKVNEKVVELGFEPYTKEDLINLFVNAVIKQGIYPDCEQYLDSIIQSISMIYPELLPILNEKLSFLSKTREEKIIYMIDELFSKFNMNPEEIQQLKDKYCAMLKVENSNFAEIGQEIIDLSRKIISAKQSKIVKK